MVKVFVVICLLFLSSIAEVWTHFVFFAALPLSQRGVGFAAPSDSFYFNAAVTPTRQRRKIEG